MRLAILSSLLLTAACATPVDFDNTYIIEGRVDTTHHAVGVVGFGCTGTLVEDQCTVLTAAHCVAAGAYGHVYLRGEKYPVKSLAIHPRYGETLPLIVESDYVPEASGQVVETHAYDIAVLRLSTCPAADQVTPIPLASTPTARGTALEVLGYGMTELHPKSAPPQGSAEPETPPPTPPDPFLSAPLPTRMIGENLLSMKSDGSFGFEGGNGERSTTCNGDSGGPTLRTNAMGIEELVGVHSTALCVDDYLTDYGYDEDMDWRLSFDVFVQPSLSWIRDPQVCTGSQRLACDDNSSRLCEEGMWSAACVPDGIF